MAVLRARVRTIPYQWVVVGLAVWASMGVAWPFQGLPVLYPFIQEDLKLSATQLGLITAAMLGGGIPTHVLGGLWLDVSGVRRVMTLVLMAQGLVVAAFFLGVSLPVILIVAVLAGVLEAPGYLGGARSLLDWVPRQRRGLATGLWSTGGAMGGIIAASVLPSFAQATSWQVAVLAVGGVIFLLGLVYGYLYRDAPQTGLVHPRVGLAALPILLRHLGLAGATIWASVFRALTYVLLTYLLLFLKDNLELSVVVAGRYLATAFFISLFARVGWGLVSDVLFKARRLVVCGIVGVVASIGFAGLSLSGNGKLAAGFDLSIRSPPGCLYPLLGSVVHCSGWRDGRSQPVGNGPGRLGNDLFGGAYGPPTAIWPAPGPNRLLHAYVGCRCGHGFHQHDDHGGSGPARVTSVAGCRCFLAMRILRVAFDRSMG